MKRALALCSVAFIAAVSVPLARQQASTPQTGDFTFAFDARGVSSLKRTGDPFNATLMPGAGRGGRAGAAPAPPPVLGLTVTYRTGAQSEWATATRAAMTSSADTRSIRYTSAATAPLSVSETYASSEHAFDWTIDLRARQAVHIGDLAISIPVQGTNGATPADIFERGFLKHQFVSGAGSFFFYVRASGAPPFLLVTVKPGTKLEYFSGTQLFVHSEKSGTAETRGTWRQPHTGLDLPPNATVS